MSQKQSKGQSGPPSTKIRDPRFTSFETDPRYRLPSKRHGKTKIDKRFSNALQKDDAFTAVAKVDRYGRRLKENHRKKALDRLYEEEDEDEEEDGAGIEVEDDTVVRRELEKADKAYDPARGGGFSSSESDSDSDDEEETQLGGGGALIGEAPPDMQRYREEQPEIPTGEVTNRIAIVNLDWDHIKSVDLLALFSSFVPAGGRIEKVSIYPSEFGKERMEREDVEGPPKEVFKAKVDDEEHPFSSDEDSEENDEDEDSDYEVKKDLLKESDEKDFDSNALRTYQLDRLRYYYAVMVCSNKSTAQKIYEMTDGSEYLASSNFLDLRFIPDDVTFDDEPRDESTSVPQKYKPVEFVTDALQHSKVKLTWDMHPEEVNRKETIKNAFSGSRNDIAENDFKAYIGTDSDSDEEEAQPETEPRLSKKELARQKMREALGLGAAKSSKGDDEGVNGDLEVTFTPALLENGRATKNEVEETTAEAYMRKERERKAMRKAAAVAKREGRTLDDEDAAEPTAVPAAPTDDLGFDDPFFAAEEPAKLSKTAQRKEERLKKREARETEEQANANEKAQLQMLMDEGDAAATHFDMVDVVRAEKGDNKKKKGKHRKKDMHEDGDKVADPALPENFEINDPRFGAILDNHEFAIDPSNTRFKATSAVKKLLEQGRKKRKAEDGDEGTGAANGQSAKSQQGGLGNLVKSIKKRSKKS